jgi:hypothetical protein
MKMAATRHPQLATRNSQLATRNSLFTAQWEIGVCGNL